MDRDTRFQVLSQAATDDREHGLPGRQRLNKARIHQYARAGRALLASMAKGRPENAFDRGIKIRRSCDHDRIFRAGFSDDPT